MRASERKREKEKEIKNEKIINENSMEKERRYRGTDRENLNAIGNWPHFETISNCFELQPTQFYTLTSEQ